MNNHLLSFEIAFFYICEKNKYIMNDNELLNGALETLTNINDSMPQPIKDNLWKVIGKLCTAGLNVPLVHLEGYVNNQKAKYETRARISNTVGDKIASGINVPIEYSEKTLEIFAKKIIGEQLNIDEIVRFATDRLNNKADNYKNSSTEEISEEWINEFETTARTKTTEDMRAIFGKILAGEIRYPGTFSIRTLKIVSQLDQKVAQEFIKLCEICIHTRTNDVIKHVFAPAFNIGPMQSKDFTEFGISLDSVTDMIDYGLVSPFNDYECDFESCIKINESNFESSFWFADKNIVLTPKESWKRGFGTGMNGAFLTPVGKDLFSILTINNNHKVYLKLHSFFDKYGLELNY